MSYIEESLSKGETVVQVFPHHTFVGMLVGANFMLCFFTLGLWLPVAIYFWLKWRNTEQGVTNKRVIYKSGIFSRTTDEMRLSAIESIKIEQSIWGRIFGFGEVIVAGRGDGDVVLRWMADPLEVKKTIESAEHDYAQVKYQP